VGFMSRALYATGRVPLIPIEWGVV